MTAFNDLVYIGSVMKITGRKCQAEDGFGLTIGDERRKKGPPLEIGPRASQSNTDSVGGKPALMVRIDKEPLVIC